jgi:regulatory protein
MVSRAMAGADSGPAEVPGDPEQDLGDPESVARAVCLQQLTKRARSRAELATTLRKRGVPNDAAARVLDRFTEVGLIDDAALAQTLAAAQHRERGLAGRAVAAKLRRRGLDDEVVGAAVAAIDPDHERARAEALVRKRLPALAALPVPVQQRRLVGLLARKGYSPSVSWEVVGAALHRDRLDVEGGDEIDVVL